jgi:hypothetical protein
MHKISLIVLLAAAVLVSGCYTKGYMRATNLRTQSLKSDTNQVAGQANK